MNPAQPTMQILCMFIGVWLIGRVANHEIAKEFLQGKTSRGEWGRKLLCAHGVRVSGFRLKVDPAGSGDDSALNGIQLACADGTVSKEITGVYGEWQNWKYCTEGGPKLHSSQYIVGFAFRSQGDQGPHRDDVAGTNVRALCHDGKQIDGGGLDWGTWDHRGYEKCKGSTYFCGVQTKNEGNQYGGDDTGMNQIKFFCCNPKKEIMMTENFVMGKTMYGTWSEVIMCKSSGQVSGFRLRVEGSTGSDDTALNGIQLMCKDGQATPKINGNYGTWRQWQLCDLGVGGTYHSYVRGFNFRSEGKQYTKDDTAGNNVKMICTNKNIIDGQGTSWGTWDRANFQTCPYESFLCGVQARIEAPQYRKDDTSLNQIKFICCKVEDEECPIKVEPLGCYNDKRHDRTMREEILNERDPTNPNFGGDHLIDWFNFPKYLPAFRCRCAMKAAAKGYTVFGIQMYAECWSAENAHETYGKHGPSKNCRDTKYKMIAHELQACPVQTGVPNTNFVYRISSQDAECSVGFSPVGCYEDFMNIPRPVPNYEHNERDDTIDGHNGLYIEWNNWNIYHKKMICRCAQKARKLSHHIFSIQFWGECWTGYRNETEHNRDGPSTRCRGKDYKPCPCNAYHCVGMQQANYVYNVYAQSGH